MKLNIFISYSHDDGHIATSLSNLLQAAFGPALTEVFLDKSGISFGSSIKASVMGALKRADLLITVLAGAQPVSALSWPGFEIGTFLAFWEDEHFKQGPHKDKEKGRIVGRVCILSNGTPALGPEQGQRPVNLGIAEHLLSEASSGEKLNQARKTAAVANGELLQFLREIDEQISNDPDYVRFKENRNNSLADLARAFKEETFDVLRNRVRDRSKPTRQLIVRHRGPGSSLAEDAKIISVAGASEVFGKAEGDPRLFRKTDECLPGSERYETTWEAFKAAVNDNPYGDYWCGVIEQAAICAATAGAELDSNLVLISSRGQRFRIIATTVTTYFNNDSEVSLYLIEALQRPDRGDADTSILLNCLTIICRFRFAFLEGASHFYWRNFGRSPLGPRDLLMELDYLKSESIRANIEQPGAWERFVKNSEELTEMMRIWNEVDTELRRSCNVAIRQREAVQSAANEVIIAQLKRISDEVRPFNTRLGAAIAKELVNAFEGKAKG